MLLSTLKQLQGKDHRSFFHKPVDVKEVPDYLDIVSCPMDFSTMKKKIQSQQYFHLRDFQKDFDLIIDNCTLYNAKTTVYYQAALKLKQAVSLFSHSILYLSLFFKSDSIEDDLHQY
uniref:Bromo domain-containing protein n=1 Tax=Helobdella robusta TaxID=6412 RepID=T1G505_HELRO